MYIPSANTGAEHKCNCNRCFGFLEYPAIWHNKHREIQSKWSSKCSEKLYIVHSLECPPSKIKPTFLGTVNTSGPAKHFSHLLTIPLVYPPKKEWLKLSVCSSIAKLIWQKLQKSRIFLFKNKVISTCCFFLSSLTISTTITIYWKNIILYALRGPWLCIFVILGHQNYRDFYVLWYLPTLLWNISCLRTCQNEIRSGIIILYLQ